MQIIILPKFDYEDSILNYYRWTDENCEFIIPDRHQSISNAKYLYYLQQSLKLIELIEYSKIDVILTDHIEFVKHLDGMGKLNNISIPIINYYEGRKPKYFFEKKLNSINFVKVSSRLAKINTLAPNFGGGKYNKIIKLNAITYIGSDKYRYHFENLKSEFPNWQFFDLNNVDLLERLNILSKSKAIISFEPKLTNKQWQIFAEAIHFNCYPITQNTLHFFTKTGFTCTIPHELIDIDLTKSKTKWNKRINQVRLASLIKSYVIPFIYDYGLFVYAIEKYKTHRKFYLSKTDFLRLCQK